MNPPENLSIEAQLLLEKRPRCWEWRLFAQLLSDEISRAQSCKVRPPAGKRNVVTLDEIQSWLNGRIASLQLLIHGLAHRLNANHDDIFGPIGRPGSPTSIVTFAQDISRIYRQGIEWVQLLRFAEIDEMFHLLAYEMSFMADDILQSLEGFGPTIQAQIAEALDAPAGYPITINLTLSPTLSNQDRVFAVLASLGESPERELSDSDRGYLYILQNDSMPNLLKIGRTKRNPRERVVELSSATGVPTPFHLAFQAFVERCAYAEAQVHAQLSRYRVASKREFFNVDLSTAIGSVIGVQEEIARGRGVFLST